MEYYGYISFAQQIMENHFDWQGEEYEKNRII